MIDAVKLCLKDATYDKKGIEDALNRAAEVLRLEKAPEETISHVQDMKRWLLDSI